MMPGGATEKDLNKLWLAKHEDEDDWVHLSELLK
jgi:hypothetical protein